MNYLISIIIPTYNAEKVIENSLNSIIKQTFNFDKIEVIIVDDFSKDNTLNIVKDYAKKYKNIKIITNDKNSGSPSIPRNIGIKEASTEYIMFLDQDDYYLKDICKNLYEKIITFQADFVSCLFNINSKTEYNPLKKYGAEINITNIQECPNILNLHNPHVNMIWNKIFNKSFLMKNKIKFPPECLAEDMYFMIQCYLNGKFILLNDYTGYVHVDTYSSTSNIPSKKNLNKFLCGYEKINKYLENKKYNETNFVLNELNSWTILFLNNNLNYKDQKELLKRAKPLYKNLKCNPKYESTYPKFVIIFQNIFLKIFSSNYKIGILISKIYKLLNLEKVYRKIFYSHLNNVKKLESE